MNCREIDKRLLAYWDGRADGAERREVEKHLAECAACRARVEEFQRLWSVLDELPAPQVSPTFDARLRARLAAGPVPRSVWAWLVPSPRLAVAVTVLLLLSVWLSSRPPAQVQGPPPGSDAEFRMIKDLQVLENYDVLANFEALSELPAQPAGVDRKM